MKTWLGLLVALPAFALAGCIGTDDGDTDDEGLEPTAFDADAVYAGLTADGAEAKRDGDLLSFSWQGTLAVGAPVVPFVGATTLAAHTLHTFDVAPGVGFVEATIETDAPYVYTYVIDLDREPTFSLPPPIDAVYLNSPGAQLCNANYGAAPRSCTAPIPSTVTDTTQWGVWLLNDDIAEAAYTLTVTLHPPQHMTFGDPTALLDPALKIEGVPTGFASSEPTMGVLSDGTLFVVSGSNILRSTDDGGSWADVTPPYAWPASLDPMMRADPWTDRVILDSLYVACSWAVWSDDAGDTWLVNPAACGTPVNDHQKVAVGGHFLPSPVYDGIVYYLYSDFDDGDVIISRSLDGGLTWLSVPAASPTLHGITLRRGGPVEADREGNVYTPGYVCDDGFAALEGQGVAVAYSNDHGATYSQAIVDDVATTCEGIDPGMAIDAAGNAYVAYWAPAADNDGNAVYVAASTDKGATWSEPLRVSPPALRSFELVDAVAGDEGRVAVAFAGTPDTGKGPNRADGWARWYMYVAITEDAFAPEPVWHLTQTSPMSDPIQLGCIWTNGGGEECRNLLDFIDVQVGPDGRVYVSYTDGCVEPPCETPADSRAFDGVVAIQSEGPRLFVDGAPWAAGAEETDWAGLRAPLVAR